MPVANASSALARFTVLDLTRVRAGPTAVRQLADWGANVVKVELPEHLDVGEALGGGAPRPRFPEPASQQARHHARPQVARGSSNLSPARCQGRRGGREFPPRRE